MRFGFSNKVIFGDMIISEIEFSAYRPKTIYKQICLTPDIVCIYAARPSIDNVKTIIDLYYKDRSPQL